MATNIPPHNLTEVINGIIKIIDEDEVTDEDLMIIKRTRLPNRRNYFRKRRNKTSLYKTGRGKITCKSRKQK